MREKLTGITHLIIFYAFIIPFILVVFCQANFKFNLGFANFLSVFLDLLGLGGIISVIILFIRRIVVKDKGFDTKNEDFIALILLFSIYCSGFLVEASRVAVAGGEMSKYAPIGLFLSGLFPASPSVLRTMWQIHFIIVLLFIAYIPYSKLIHYLQDL